MRRGLYGVMGFSAALLLFASAGSADAQVEFTPNVSLISDYVFRGISQTLEEPAIQGGIDASFASMIYAGIWGSSVNFGETNITTGGARAQMELDGFAGIAPSFGGFDFDFGGLYYAYPGAADSRNYDYWEVAAGVGRGVGPLSVGASIAYSPDFFAASGEAIASGIEVSVGVPNTPFTVDGNFGHQSIEDNGAFGVPDYTHWGLGASAEFLGLGFSAGMVGTNIKQVDCLGNTELCDTRVILSVGM